jgi:hypothetical protein
MEDNNTTAVCSVSDHVLKYDVLPVLDTLEKFDQPITKRLWMLGDFNANLQMKVLWIIQEDLSLQEMCKTFILSWRPHTHINLWQQGLQSSHTN